MTRLDVYALQTDPGTGDVEIIRGGQAAKGAFWSSDDGRVQLATRIADLPQAKLRPDALAFYMAQMAQGAVEQRISTDTLFKGVSKAPAAGRTVISRPGGGFSVTPFAPAAEIEPGLSEEVLAQRLKEALLDTARALVSEHESIAVEASGGVDSTLMAALARRVLPANTPIRAISLLYPFYEFRRERQFIDIAVATYDGEHVCFDGSACLSFADLELDQPLSEPSLVLAGLAQHRVILSAVARPGALLLNGNGGDSLFALGPLRQLRYKVEARRLDWMSAAFHASFSGHLGVFRNYFEQTPEHDHAAFLSGGDLDDRWIEREIAPAYGVTRSHLFLHSDILPLVSALWTREPEPPTGKWILARHFGDLVPEAILHRPGKVAYDGLYARAFRAARPALEGIVTAHGDHLAAVGIDVGRLLTHVDRVAKGSTEGDLELAAVLTYLIWLQGWQRAGRGLL